MKHNFVHLHLHTKYSMLDGMCRFEDVIEACRQNNMLSCAITDHGYMYGVVEFYAALNGAGIKPIIGLETYIVDDIKQKTREKGHLILLVKEEAGYKNLLKIANFAATTGFYYKPTVDKQFLREHSSGLIALSACLQGEVSSQIVANNPDAAEIAAKDYLKMFGEGNFFLELQNHGLEEEMAMNRGLKELSKKLSIPLVATNDVHYMKKDDAKAQDLLVCIKTGKKLKDTDRLSFKTDQFYFKNFEEMKQALPEDEEAILHTSEVAAMCKYELPLGKKTYMPSYQTVGGLSYEDYLEKLAREEFKKKFPAPTADETSRFEHEVATIKKMGYSGYFLIIRDIIEFARTHNIPVGPGRGSAAGSLVSYVLGITSLNPLKYSLLFERFLNPERVSPPDIDTDFADDGRDKVIDFIVKKFGNDRVAQIATFQQLKPKAAIRDVGRVLDIPISNVNKFCKVVPEGPAVSFKDVLKDPQFQSFVNDQENQPWADEILEYATRIEGMLRQDSTHAAGVVIAPDNLVEFAPLTIPKSAGEDEATGAALGYMTQYQMESLEKIGLLKFDILGLRNLTVIKKTIEIVRETRGIEIELKEGDYGDQAVYDLLTEGRTLGVFQLESEGMRDILQKMKPGCFEDIIAIISLFRPGPMKMIDDFIKRKKGLQPITYDFPMLEEVLKETYGIAVYQEQVMQIAVKVAGFSMAKADNLRRAMAKKKEKEMAKIKVEFLEGAKKHKINEDKATELFEKLEQFSSYGFNKSHAAAYAVLAYQTAYLKAHYPSEYMAALMTSVMYTIDKTAFYIDDARENRIQVAKPDVNRSTVEFSVEKGVIRYALAAIKNVGVGAAEAIVAERKANGDYKDIFDFCRRVNGRLVNSRAIESLVKSGAFDNIYPLRSQVYAAIGEAMKQAESFQKDMAMGQFSLFGAEPTTSELPSVPPWPDHEKLTFEREVLGTYVSSHPLARYEKLLKNFSTPIRELIKKNPDNTNIIIGGVINGLTHKVSRNGEKNLHFTLEDTSGKIHVIVPERIAKEKQVFKENALFMVRGKYNGWSDDPFIMLESVITLDESYEILGKFLHIKLREIGLEESVSRDINALLSANKGNSTVVMHLLTRDNKEVEMVLSDDMKVRVSEELLHKLEALAGSEHVWMGWKR